MQGHAGIEWYWMEISIIMIFYFYYHGYGRKAKLLKPKTAGTQID